MEHFYIAHRTALLLNAQIQLEFPNLTEEYIYKIKQKLEQSIKYSVLPLHSILVSSLQKESKLTDSNKDKFSLWTHKIYYQWIDSPKKVHLGLGVQDHKVENHNLEDHKEGKVVDLEVQEDQEDKDSKEEIDKEAATLEEDMQEDILSPSKKDDKIKFILLHNYFHLYAYLYLCK